MYQLEEAAVMEMSIDAKSILELCAWKEALVVLNNGHENARTPSKKLGICSYKSCTT